MTGIKNKIKKIVKFYFGEIGEYFVLTKIDLLYFFLQKFLLLNNVIKKSCVLNFIITSKAEIRVFSPLLEYLLNKNLDISVNIFYSTKELRFNTDIEKKISKNKKIKIRDKAYFLINSTLYPSFVNIICLDHAHFKMAHNVGIQIIDYLNSNGAKTVCIQHGGNQEDNILGQITSKSKYQIVFGRIIYDELIKSDFNRKEVFLTGNPLHDKLQNIAVNSKIKDRRKIISLITCLHTEYEDRVKPEKCYKDYITNVFKSMDFNKYLLLIKMHPNDSLDKNIYENVRSKLKINEIDVKIFYSDDEENTVYDVLSISDLVLSRSSSIIEEALMINKKVIAYDLFEDGSSKFYDFLLKYDSYKKVIGDDSDLRPIIDDLVLKKIDTDIFTSELIFNTTYQLDGKSSERIINALKQISILAK